jgi:hypothetical protein
MMKTTLYDCHAHKSQLTANKESERKEVIQRTAAEIIKKTFKLPPPRQKRSFQKIVARGEK